MIGFAFRLAGRVQGVSCRDGIVDLAVRTRVVGHVRNVDDGTVQGRVHGETAAVGAFLVGLHQPSTRAVVAQITLRPLGDVSVPTGFVRIDTIGADQGDWPAGT